MGVGHIEKMEGSGQWNKETEQLEPRNEEGRERPVWGSRK